MHPTPNLRGCPAHVSVMQRRLTDFAPGLLVPAAWAVTVGAHAGAVGRHPVFVALCVMDVLLVAFYAAGRSAMDGPVLRVWRRVLVAGFLATLVGTVDLAVDAGSDPVLPLTVLAWVLLPGVAYLATGRAVAASPFREVYLLAGVASLAGAGGYALAWTLGDVSALGDPVARWSLAVVGVGQTAGILAAVAQNAGTDQTAGDTAADAT